MIASYLGTKGGTGTTTLAVNGAADVRRLTRRPTIVVDFKTGPGDVSLFLGLRPRHSILNALDHMAWIDPPSISKYVIQHECGLHVLAAGDDPSELVPMEVIERRYVTRVLAAVGGNKTLAARILGFDRKTLYRKLGQRDA